MITILRLGHRKSRDKRITTHVALVGRALGADEFILSGEMDGTVLDSVKKVVSKWGGPFRVKYEANWKKVLRNFKGARVHLTMYGEPLVSVVEKIRAKNLLVVVGAEKVPREVYGMVDFNASVSNQPHSEVAALAVFLHEYFGGRELEKKFKRAKIVVEPSERGKKFAKRL